jgi:hypothetical protein
MIASLQFYLKHPYARFDQNFSKRSLNENGTLAKPAKEQTDGAN